MLFYWVIAVLSPLIPEKLFKWEVLSGIFREYIKKSRSFRALQLHIRIISCSKLTAPSSPLSLLISTLQNCNIKLETFYSFIRIIY